MSSSMPHTLAGLLTRLREGGREDDPGLERRLDEAFAKHHGLVRAVCRRELPRFSDQEVEEVLQDVLVEAWSKLPLYRPERPFRAFLVGIAAKKCSNARRRRRDVLTDDGVLDPASEERPSLTRMSDEERDRFVEEAARAVLGPEEQDIVELRYVQGYPREDVARLLGMPDADAVRVVLQRVKRRLRKELEKRLRERGASTSFLDL
jgi:RNA polymerase sigma-70 factor, ECF subfamily